MEEESVEEESSEQVSEEEVDDFEEESVAEESEEDFEEESVGEVSEVRNFTEIYERGLWQIFRNLLRRKWMI